MEIDAKSVRHLRELASLSQADLAKRIGVSSATIANWEAGRAVCSGPAARVLLQEFVLAVGVDTDVEDVLRAIKED
jgi:DNA-binding transcriptional regulator YiaG